MKSHHFKDHHLNKGEDFMLQASGRWKQTKGTADKKAEKKVSNQNNHSQ